MAERRCTRCGAARPDDFRWCRKCGLDFQNPPASTAPDPPARVTPAPIQPSPRVDVRQVNDRANMARLARDAMDVRCLGTIGGLTGAFVGFIVFGVIGSAIGGAGVLLGLVGIPVGWWVGVRAALGRLAR